MNTIIDATNIFKSFLVGAQEVSVLNDVSFSVNKDDFLVIFGPSGCGKSTLLHTILGLEPPTKGTIRFLDENLYLNKNEDQRSDFRKKHIGMVYQQPNWVRSLTVIENVSFPLMLLGKESHLAIVEAEKYLKTVGMLDWAKYMPTELSSGQQQRVAVARALVINPEVIIADEPTGNLDFESGQQLMEILTVLNKEGKTVIMVTHDLDYLRFAKRVVRMLDGKIVEIYDNENQKEKNKLSGEIKSKRGDGLNGHSSKEDVVNHQ